MSLSQHQSNAGELDQILPFYNDHSTMAHSWGTGIHLSVNMLRMSKAQHVYKGTFLIYPFPRSLSGKLISLCHHDSAYRMLLSSSWLTGSIIKQNVCGRIWDFEGKENCKRRSGKNEGKRLERRVCTQFCPWLAPLPSVTTLSA